MGFAGLRALRRLKQGQVTVLVWPGSITDALLEFRRTVDRTASSVIEEGWLIEALMDGHDLSLDELALRLGRSKTWVHGRLGVVRQLPESVSRLVLKGRLSGYVASKLVVPFARANPHLAESFCQTIVDQSFSVRQATDLYKILTSQPDDQARAEILKRPEQVLRAVEAASHRGKRKHRARETPEIVDRLERWCLQSVGMHSQIQRTLVSRASEDLLNRISLLWQAHRETIRSMWKELDDLARLGQGSALANE